VLCQGSWYLAWLVLSANRPGGGREVVVRSCSRSKASSGGHIHDKHISESSKSEHCDSIHRMRLQVALPSIYAALAATTAHLRGSEPPGPPAQQCTGRTWALCSSRYRARSLQRRGARPVLTRLPSRRMQERSSSSDSRLCLLPRMLRDVVWVLRESDPETLRTHTSWRVSSRCLQMEAVANTNINALVPVVNEVNA
jgi:hypothetical protein